MREESLLDVAGVSLSGSTLPVRGELLQEPQMVYPIDGERSCLSAGAGEPHDEKPIASRDPRAFDHPATRCRLFEKRQSEFRSRSSFGD